MSIEGQGHFFTIYFPGFVCFVLYFAKISGERLQDHWSSGLTFATSCFETKMTSVIVCLCTELKTIVLMVNIFDIEYKRLVCNICHSTN